MNGGHVDGVERQGRDHAVETRRPDPDDHDYDPEPQVVFLIAGETRGDALIDDVGLLEDQLPRRHCVPTIAMISAIPVGWLR